MEENNLDVRAAEAANTELTNQPGTGATGVGRESGNQPDLSIEDAFAQIRTLLAEMDQDDVTLEKSFENYEKGMKLIRYCNDKIDRVEKKVQKMNADGSVTDLDADTEENLG